VGDAWALSALSLTDAIETSGAEFEINTVEYVTELNSVFGLVDAGRLISTLPSIASRVPGLSLIAKILHVLSDATLIYSFALAPAVSDIEKITAKASAFRHRYLSGGTFGKLSLRGKYVTDLDLPGFDNVKLTVRCTCEGEIPPDSLLSSVLPLRAIGLYPGLSTIWEVIPYSFLIDGLFNIGNLLESVDTRMTVCAFDVKYSVVSVLYEWIIPENDMSRYGITDVLSASNGPGFEPHYRAYFRLAFKGVPEVTPSPLLSTSLVTGFLPNWEVSSSLLWKLID
jgi:hypothetical protein